MWNFEFGHQIAVGYNNVTFAQIDSQINMDTAPKIPWGVNPLEVGHDSGLKDDEHDFG